MADGDCRDSGLPPQMCCADPQSPYIPHLPQSLPSVAPPHQITHTNPPTEISSFLWDHGYRLGNFRLLSHNGTDRVAHQQQELTSRSCDGWEVQDQGTQHVCCLLRPSSWFTDTSSHCALTYLKRWRRNLFIEACMHANVTSPIHGGLTPPYPPPKGPVSYHLHIRKSVFTAYEFRGGFLNCHSLFS